MKREAEEKARLRRELRRRMGELSHEARQQSDTALFRSFLSLPELEKAKTVLLFYGVNTEPETSRLIPLLFAKGKQVCLPRCLPQHQMEARMIRQDSVLVPGHVQIPEPPEDCPLVLKKDLDLILVPALSCDRRGIRLGQGGGYYDRYLENYSGVTVSFCRKEFLQKELPSGRYDKKVMIVLTEKETLVPEGFW